MLERACLVGCLALGLLTAAADLLWPTTIDAVSVDVILTPDELRDPKLIDVVYRTHRFNRGRRSPVAILGLTTAATAAAGLFALTRRRSRTPDSRSS